MDDIFDYRRFILLCFKKWLIVLSGLVLGAALFGLIYFIASNYFSGPDTYRSESTYYITFNTEDYEALAVYYNDYTWNLILATDKIAGRASEISGISMDEINKCVWKPMMYDLRMITVYADNKDPETAEKIQKAIGQALSEFPINEEGFAAIELWDGPHTNIVAKQNFTLRLTVIGGITGFIISLLAVMLKCALDVRVYTLEELKNATSLTGAGYIFGKSSKYCDDMLAANVAEAVRHINANKVGICYVQSLNEKSDNTFDINKFTEVTSSAVSKENVQFQLIANNDENDISKKCGEYDAIILLIDQENDTMPAVKRSIDTLASWNKTIASIIICNSSKSFYDMYYFGKKKS